MIAHRGSEPAFEYATRIALVGLSAGGLFAYVFPGLQHPARPDDLIVKLLFWFAVSIMASAYLVMAIPIHHGDLIYHRAEVSVQLWRLVVYHITVAPFFIGGLAIAVTFRSDPDRIGRLYFADLFAAALGCICSPLMLQYFGAPGAIIVAGIPAGALAIVALARSQSRLRFVIWAPLALCLIGPIWPGLLSFRTLNTMGEVHDAKYRSFHIEPRDIVFERWALDAWTIIRADSIPAQWEKFRGWGLSDRYDGPIPDFRLVNYNARFSTYVTSPGSNSEAFAEWIDADLSSVHHLLGRSFKQVLNIGAGGGREVLAALQHGAERVVAVDVSEVVIDEIMQGQLLEFSGGLYRDSRVEAVADEGRTFAERSSERFDLIEFSIVGGMNLEKMDLVRVDDLFTKEALETYIGRLTRGGVFSYGMYTTRSDLVAALVATQGSPSQPYIPALRTLAGVRLALENAQPSLEAKSHFLIAALPGRVDPRYDLVHIIATLKPFTTEEVARFRAQAGLLDFKVLYPAPGPAILGSGERNLYAEIVETSNLDELSRALPFSVLPATDDRPFQYALDATHLRRAAVAVTLQRSDGRRLLRSSWSLLLYFSCIGFAYMAVEIAALLRLQSYLGKPIYGLSVGLFAFLLSSGLGSALTNRIVDDRLERSVHVIVAVLLAIGLVFSVVAEPLFAATIAESLVARIAIAITAIFPLAFTMGLLFPVGIRLIARESTDLIPWAWAMNGCFSVLGIFGTRIMALFLGFSRALVLGLFAYALVSVCVWLHSRRAERIA